MKEKKIDYYRIDYKAGDKAFVSKPHSHTHYEIFYFEKGNASHFIDFKEYEITDNSFFLIAYNQVHYITAKSNTYNVGCVISIDKEVIHLLDHALISLFGKFSQPPAFYLTEEKSLTSSIFNQIQKELLDTKPKAFELVFNLIKIVLTYIWREGHHTDPHKSVNQKLYFSYLKLLENNFLTLKSVQDYAALLSITTKKLNNICKEVSNQTALPVIHQRLNLEAKRKLFYGENQIKNICYDLGFEDTGHFNNFFKKLNNKTPKQFRSEMAQIFN